MYLAKRVKISRSTFRGLCFGVSWERFAPFRNLFNLFSPLNVPQLSLASAIIEKALSLLGRLCSGFGVEGATQAYMERRGLRGFLAAVILQEVGHLLQRILYRWLPQHLATAE